MPPVHHVCLDTNIYIRIVTQGVPGCEVEHWEKLKQFVSTGRAKLLVPEVILLELRKEWRLVPAEIEKQTRILTKKILDELGLKSMYSEVRDLRQVVEDCLKGYAVKKEADSKSRYENIVTFLGQEVVVHLPINQDVLLQAERRYLSGGMADPSKQSRADCMIVELLSAHFRERNVERQTLLICTENTSDFAVNVEKEPALHPMIQKDLPPANLFIDLKSVVEFIEARKELHAVPAEKVQEAAREEDVERAAAKPFIGPRERRQVSLSELREAAIARKRQHDRDLHEQEIRQAARSIIERQKFGGS